MADPQLLSYIRQRSAAGATRSQISQELLGNGWPIMAVNEALEELRVPLDRVESAPPVAPFAPAPLPPPQVPAVASEAAATYQNAVAPSPSHTAILRAAHSLLGDSWELYKQRWSVYLKIQFLALVLAAIPILLIVGSVLLLPSLSGSGLSIPLYVIIVVCVICIPAFLSWGILAQACAIKDGAEGILAGEAFQRARYKLLSYWWIEVLAILIALGWTLLFIVPGLVFAIWFSFSTWIFLSEDIRGSNALIKSREYIRGRFWSIVWRLIFLWLIYFIISIALNIFTSILTAVTPAALKVIIVILGYFISAVLYVIWAPLSAIYSFLIYQDLYSITGGNTPAPRFGRKLLYIVVPFLLFSIITVAMYFSAATIFSWFFPPVPSTTEQASSAAIATTSGPPASLDEAKLRYADATIQSDLASIRTQAELYFSDDHNGGSYATGGSYAGMCTNDHYIAQMLADIRSVNGGTAPICNTSANNYAITSPLVAVPNTAWCVDGKSPTGTSRALNASGMPYTGMTTGASPALANLTSMTCN